MRNAVNGTIHLESFLPFAVMYINEHPEYALAAELGVPRLTTLRYRRLLHNIFHDVLVFGKKDDALRIGGPGIRVEIDEALLQRAKTCSAAFAGRRA